MVARQAMRKEELFLCASVKSKTEEKSSAVFSRDGREKRKETKTNGDKRFEHVWHLEEKGVYALKTFWKKRELEKLSKNTRNVSHKAAPYERKAE